MKVFIACPTHDGRIHFKTAEALYDQASRVHELFIEVGSTSLLNWNCNQMLCRALNMRAQHSFTWFAMLHSDVAPEPMWLDKLIDIAEKEGADMLSACIAIKDESGDVSTGISNPLNDHWNLSRINKILLSDTYLPETFDIEDVQNVFKRSIHPESKLLVNTGCCIVRMDLASQVLFQGEDRIIINGEGQYEAHVDSEDWNFSRQVNDLGGKVMATYAVKCQHVGVKAYTATIQAK
jgi:GT2 family glycosyltransferase